MFAALIGIADKVLGLISWAKDFFVHKQAVDEGKTEEKLNQTLRLEIAEKKDLQDVQKANEFKDHLAADPDFAKRVCDALRSPDGAQ